VGTRGREEHGRPARVMVNAYGPTETTSSSNHEARPRHRGSGRADGPGASRSRFRHVDGGLGRAVGVDITRAGRPCSSRPRGATCPLLGGAGLTAHHQRGRFQPFGCQHPYCRGV